MSSGAFGYALGQFIALFVVAYIGLRVASSRGSGSGWRWGSVIVVLGLSLVQDFQVGAGVASLVTIAWALIQERRSRLPLAERSLATLQPGRASPWWKVWIVVSSLWVICTASFAFVSKDERTDEDYKLESLTRLCTTYEDGKPLLLNRAYTEAQLRQAHANPELRAKPWWPELDRCVKSYDIDYAAEHKRDRLAGYFGLGMGAIIFPIGSLLIGLFAAWVVRLYSRPPTSP